MEGFREVHHVQQIMEGRHLDVWYKGGGITRVTKGDVKAILTLNGSLRVEYTLKDSETALVFVDKDLNGLFLKKFGNIFKTDEELIKAIESGEIVFTEKPYLEVAVEKGSEYLGSELVEEYASLVDGIAFVVEEFNSIVDVYE